MSSAFKVGDRVRVVREGVNDGLGTVVATDGPSAAFGFPYVVDLDSRISRAMTLPAYCAESELEVVSE